MKWMFLPLKRYADFEGRSPRIEYWLFTLFVWLVSVGLIAIGFALTDARGSPGEEVNPAFGLVLLLVGVFWLGILVPSIAVTVRRLHDRDLTGWLYLVNFVPYIGGLIIFVFMVLPGTEGENTYGPNPLDEDGVRPDQLEEMFT